MCCINGKLSVLIFHSETLICFACSVHILEAAPAAVVILNGSTQTTALSEGFQLADSVYSPNSQ